MGFEQNLLFTRYYEKKEMFCQLLKLAPKHFFVGKQYSHMTVPEATE